MSFFRPLSSFVSVALVAASLWVAPARADDVSDAQALIKDMMANAVNDFGGKTLANDQLEQIVIGYFGKYASVPLSSRDILGRYWARATDDERTEFQSLMVEYAIDSWSKQLNGLPPNQDLIFTASESTPEGRIILHSLITNTDTTPVDWQVAHAEDGRLVITDVSIEGASIVETMKADFTTIIRANGGKISALLEALRKKIADYKAAGI
jgi:phospholipid transport system substrate-binding protein